MAQNSSAAAAAASSSDANTQKRRWKNDDKAKKAASFCRLHRDALIQNQQIDKWAKWYNEGKKREFPEFDIFGPFTKDEEKVRGNDPQDWEVMATKIEALKELQRSGKDIAGRSLKESLDTQSAPKGYAALMPPGLRTVADDRNQDIESGEWLTVHPRSGGIRRLHVPGGKSSQAAGECLALVRTYGGATQPDYDISGVNCQYGYRARPFYKDYRHYSRHGFAGRGAVTSWAKNPKYTSEDYDPTTALYTKPRGDHDGSAKHDETYVNHPARCDLRPPLTGAQKKLLLDYPDHVIGKLPSEMLSVKFDLGNTAHISMSSMKSTTSSRSGFSSRMQSSSMSRPGRSTDKW